MEAAKKKHEAIETDTAAYEERVKTLEDLAQELEKENYHDQKRIIARKDNILRLWSYLQELLRSRRQRLEATLALQKLFQDMLHSIDWMDEIKVGPEAAHPTPHSVVSTHFLKYLPSGHISKSQWKKDRDITSPCSQRPQQPRYLVLVVA